MSAFYISSIEIRNLWGQKDFKLVFNKDVNILIGPNASGKTTILNLIRYVLDLEISNLNEMVFDDILIHLQHFEKSTRRKIYVKASDDGLSFKVSNRTFNLDPDALSRRVFRRRGSALSSRIRLRELNDLIGDLVPIVWLPVSRRLPIPHSPNPQLEREVVHTKRRKLESVDQCLYDLLEQLVKYRLTLDVQLSERYKDFERRVLELMLYSKKLDKIESISPELPTKAEKEQLFRAFESASLMDSKMRKRIDVHFNTAAKTIRRINESEKGIKINDFLILPLIERTKSMVSFAVELEVFRKQLFAPLRRYEEIVSEFLNEKSVKVAEGGELEIFSEADPQNSLDPRSLSSGEKQILILLTQALLWENRPVVYIADEPELSLHVKWQEKLINSLIELGGKLQIIVATHSPDIVGPFVEKVIDLERV